MKNMIYHYLGNNFQISCYAALDKINNSGFVSSNYSDQPEHPASLIKGFVVLIKKAYVLSYPLNSYERLWPDLAAQADMSLCCCRAYIVGFSMVGLKYLCGQGEIWKDLITMKVSNGFF